MVKAVSAAPTKSDRGQVAPIASRVKRFRQEPRSRRLALAASASQHILPALPQLQEQFQRILSCRDDFIDKIVQNGTVG